MRHPINLRLFNWRVLALIHMLQHLDKFAIQFDISNLWGATCNPGGEEKGSSIHLTHVKQISETNMGNKYGKQIWETNM